MTKDIDEGIVTAQSDGVEYGIQGIFQTTVNIYLTSL